MGWFTGEGLSRRPFGKRMNAPKDRSLPEMPQLRQFLNLCCFEWFFCLMFFLLKTYPKVWWFIIVIFPLHGSCLRSRPFSETSIRAISFFNIAARRLKSLVASLEQLHHHRTAVFAFFSEKPRVVFTARDHKRSPAVFQSMFDDLSSCLCGREWKKFNLPEINHVSV